MEFGICLWHWSDYYLYLIMGDEDRYLLYICGGNPVEGSLDEIRDYLKDQLGEDYHAAVKNFYTK